MKASELIALLQKEIEFFGCDPSVVINHSNDGSWLMHDVWCSERGLMHGFVSHQPAIMLEYSNTLLNVSDIKEQQND